MRDDPPYRDRRQARRLQLGSPARILFDDGSVVEAECVSLGGGGMTLRSAYVPGEAEVIKVEIPGPSSGIERPSLVVRMAVRRCHRVTTNLYEIGGAIVEVIS